MKDYFYEIADFAVGLLKQDEVLLVEFAGEESDFVRFNHDAVRQAGHVVQRILELTLINGNRSLSATLTLSGSAETDRALVEERMRFLRENVSMVPEDPYLLYSTEVHSTEREREAMLIPAREAVDAIVRLGEGKDLVGIFAQGPIYRGFANSFGQKNWYSAHSFDFDWSVYLREDKAVKSRYAGFEWDTEILRSRMADATDQLEMLARPAKSLKPGKFRVFLTPRALGELVSILAWNGFGIKNHKGKVALLTAMTSGDARLHESVTIAESVAEGLAPNFGDGGFIRPDRVELIKNGEYKGYLVSPASAKEFGVETTGCSRGEMADSLEMMPGDLPFSEALERLGTGVYVNDMWYVNVSDLTTAKLTGMTRFATFWVEEGKIVGPLEVMRFDESIYKMLGDNLISITREREMLISSSTYTLRHTGSMHLPGILVKDFTFVL